MPKNAIAFRSQLSKTPTAPFPGTLIQPGTTPADRFAVRELSAIAARLGTVESGTLYAGDRNGAHLVVGEAVKGLQMYEAPNMLSIGMSWLNGGSARIGRLDGPGITMARGDVEIDGDCNVVGSISANRLNIGPFAKIVLEDDQIRVGEDLGDGYCGFLASINSIGGWYNGEQTWYVENTTGKIVSVDPNVTAGEYVRTQLGAGYLDVFNFENESRDAGIRFRGYWYDDGLEDYEYNELLVKVAAANEPYPRFIIRNTVNSYGALFQIEGPNEELFVSLGPGGLILNDPFQVNLNHYGISSQGASFTINALNRDSGSGEFSGYGQAIVYGNAFELRHMTLRMTPDTYRGYAPKPTEPGEGEIWWNPVEHRQETYTGEKWVYNNTTDV